MDNKKINRLTLQCDCSSMEFMQWLRKELFEINLTQNEAKALLEKIMGEIINKTDKRKI